jgi:hypothetical protein
LNLEDLQKHLSFELTDTEKDILYEFTRAREVMEVLNHPGWLHIQDLMDSKVTNCEERYLNLKGVDKDTLFAVHGAVKMLRTFVADVKAQLASTGDWLKDPQAIQDMINRANLPDPADLEGEL